MRWNYGKTIFVIMLVLILFLPAIGLAGSTYPRFKDIEQLVLIMQQLQGDELVMIKPEKHCVCACWEGTWACVDEKCKELSKTCENPPVEEEK